MPGSADSLADRRSLGKSLFPIVPAKTTGKQVLAKVALGQDPQAEKADRRDKDRSSLRTLVEEFLTAKEPQLRAHSRVEIRRYLTGAYFKPLYNLPLDTITRRDVSARVV